MRFFTLINRLTVLLVCVFFFQKAQSQDAQLPQLNYLYKPGDNGYACFRIPALLSTANGTLLAFAEARKNNCGDSGDIDLVVRRSTDGGKTWGDMQIVWNDSTNTCGNPVPIEDKATGKIWLISTWNLGTDHEKEIVAGTSQNTRRAFVLSSGDVGKTWSAAREITPDVKMPDWTWYATGPCHGVQISTGKYKGRLVVPVNHIEKATNQNFAHIIYSDDHGATWHLGQNTPFDKANETTVAEIKKGNLMLNMRNSGRVDHARKVTTSKDGGNTWAPLQVDSTLTEPICQGSLLNYTMTNKKTVLLFSNPASQTKRADLTLRLSKDYGKTWAASRVIYPGPAAYSDIAVNNNQVGCLYEAGATKPYEGVAWMTVDLNDLLK
ncbi:sialidase family protein [Mucilaginibacter ginkgonis]|uniref:exo-alpha-sialidase n=1 Tax=Mucilaginibacter ginkgonis TaxID=2682091 RepID=A0A6I4HU64_9SPHI|nr:sialidase family protein [Mucilaginibacter ginkgonis]QQL50302.1 exo-alpha-sialidase [Mucilaginibacter ginkgonis]